VSQRAKRVIEDVGGKLFGVILNNVNIKTDDNYYYYAGYSTQYGYKKRTPRAPRAKPATARASTTEEVVSENEIEIQPIEEPILESQQAPKITFVRPPHGEDKF
jgi:hypothetical protein